MKKLISMVTVISLILSMMWCAVPAGAIGDENADKPFEVTFDYDLSQAVKYPGADVEIYKTSELKETTDKAYARDPKTGEIDVSGNGDVVFHVSVSPWSWFEVSAKGQYDEIEYGDYNCVKITGIKSDTAVTIKVGDNDCLETDTEDSDGESGFIAGYCVRFRCDDGLNIKHNGESLTDDHAYTADINTFSNKDEKSEFTFTIEDERESDIGRNFYIDGQYETLVGVSGDEEVVIEEYSYYDYDKYIIKGITSDLTVTTGYIYPEEGCVAGYQINFITNGNVVYCDDRTIVGDESVYTSDIQLFGFSAGKRIYNENAQQKTITFEASNDISDFTITGDYGNFEDNGDGTFTISGITSDLTVSMKENPDVEVLPEYNVTFRFDPNVFRVDDDDYQKIENGAVLKTKNVMGEHYPNELVFRVGQAQNEYDSQIDKVITVTGDYGNIDDQDYKVVIENIRSDLTVDIGVDTTRKEINNAIRNFSSDLFKLTYRDENSEKKGTNMMVSPLSLYTDVAMFENGTAENTWREINNMLTNGNDKFGENEINDYVKKYIENAAKNDTVHIANSIYFTNRSDIKPNPDFVDTAHKYYNAEVFVATPDNAAVERINKWAADNTNNAIKEIVTPEDMDEQTISILLNAIAFNGAWYKPYNDYQVESGTFTNYNGSKTDADFMNETRDVYFDDGKALAFSKSYVGGYSFLAILPNEDVGIDNYIENMDGNTISNLLDNSYEAEVRTKLPKFEFDNKFTLNNTMKEMGMVEAFDEKNADLSRLAPSEYDPKNAYVSEVRQLTHVKLNEEGTSAQAVTAIIVDEKGSLDIIDERKEVEIFLDRPFIFAIMDNINEVPLFVGTVSKMSDDEGPINNDTDTEESKKDTPEDPDKDTDSYDNHDTRTYVYSLGMLGDVNGDNKVTAKDGMLIQRFAVNLAKLDETQQKLADVDGNNKVTAADAMNILRYTVKANVKYKIGEAVLSELHTDKKDTSDTPDTPDKNAYYFLAPEAFLDPYLDYENQTAVIGNKVGVHWYRSSGESYPVIPMTEAFNIETPVYKMPLIDQQGIESVVFKGYNEADDDNTVCYTSKVDLAGHEGMIYLLNCSEISELQEIYNPDIHGENHNLKKYAEYTEGGWFSLDPESNNYYKNSDYYKTYVYNILFNDYWTEDVPA